MEECLLDRRGNIHYYKDKGSQPVSKHEEIAKTILKEEERPLDLLINQGWIVLGSKFKGPYSAKKPTQSQINKLFDLGIRYVIDFYLDSQWKIY